MSLATLAAPFDNDTFDISLSQRSRQGNSNQHHLPMHRNRTQHSQHPSNSRATQKVRGSEAGGGPGGGPGGGSPMGGSFQTNKVSQALQRLHSHDNQGGGGGGGGEDDEDDTMQEGMGNMMMMNDFTPLGPPDSVGVQRTEVPGGPGSNMGVDKHATPFSELQTNNEMLSNSPYIQQSIQQRADRDKIQSNVGRTMQPYMFHSPADQSNSGNALISSSSSSSSEIINAGQHGMSVGQSAMMNSMMINQSQDDPLITKLNFIISLLEEQQDERTNSMYEEIVLYFFLGVFIIFLVDSFVRVGRYVR